MTVPFLDLTALHESIRPELDDALERVRRSSGFVGGAEVDRFAEAFGAAHDLPPGVGCASGTDALALALRALGIGPGDEVVVPSMTFVATAEAVVHVGATPVVADVDPVTLLLGPEHVEVVRTERTRAVLPVHLYGHLVPYEHLRAWREQGLVVVEDAAQAHLADWDGRHVGTVGHAVCFSFYPGKNLGAWGDGGMLLSSDPAVLDEARLVADHGSRSKYVHDVAGFCSRLDGLHAAILGVKLTHLDEWTSARRRVAESYAARLPEGMLVPWTAGAVHHLLVARVRDRERIQGALRDAGIGTGVHYPVPLSRQPWLAAAGSIETPAAEAAGDDVLSLPMDPLMTVEQVDIVVDALLSAVGAAG
jgi:dTDP-4-amino-4,6-dideoxygalactose transaminase